MTRPSFYTDQTVTHMECSTWLGTFLADGAAKLIENREKRKTGLYKKASLGLGSGFVPFVHSTYGHLNKAAKDSILLVQNQAMGASPAKPTLATYPQLRAYFQRKIIQHKEDAVRLLASKMTRTPRL